jgi:hypothetical protein
MDSGVREARTFAELDQRKAEADALDPMKPNMWRVGDRMGVMREPWEAVMDRAAAKFGQRKEGTK